MERAVVVADGVSGLRAGSWLAARGVAVRWLGLGALPQPAVHPIALRGDRAVLESMYGPLLDVVPRRAIRVAGALHEVPTRRRDLLRLCGLPGPGDALRQVLARLLGRRRGHTLESWCEAHLGPVATRRLALPYAEARLGPGPAALTAGQGRMLFGRDTEGGWWAPEPDAATWAEGRREAILDAGGEVLEDVTVEGLEVEDGRVVAVHTEFGRELVDDALLIDLPPAGVLELLGEEHAPGGLRRELAAAAATGEVVVTLRAGAHGLPWVVHVAEPDRPGFRVTRPAGTAGHPRPDTLRVQVACAPGDPAWQDDAEAGRAARATLVGWVADIGDVVEIRRVPGARVRCTPGSEAALDRALEAWEHLGIVPVGPRALHGPLLPEDEGAWLSLVVGEAGRLRSARRALLGAGARPRPWTLLPD